MPELLVSFVSSGPFSIPTNALSFFGFLIMWPVKEVRLIVKSALGFLQFVLQPEVSK